MHSTIPDAPTPLPRPTKQWEAASLRLLGFSQRRIAAAVGMDVRTVRRWCADPEFAGLVRDWAEFVRPLIEPKYVELLAVTLSVERAAIAAGLPPSDRRLMKARRTLKRAPAELLERARCIDAEGIDRLLDDAERRLPEGGISELLDSPSFDPSAIAANVAVSLTAWGEEIVEAARLRGVR